MAFQFRLQKVLEHRARLEDQARRDYMDAKAKTLEAQNQLKRMFEEIDSARAESQRLVTTGSGAADLVAIDQFIGGQKIRIEQKRAAIRTLKEAEERFQDVLIEAAKEKKTLEILKERERQEYLGKIEKQELAEADNLTIMRFKRGEGP